MLFVQPVVFLEGICLKVQIMASYAIVSLEKLTEYNGVFLRGSLLFVSGTVREVG